MNILFVCSSIEPGKDGVGDYTRILASELIRNGHQATIIGLNDRHLLEDIWKGDQLDDSENISVLRFSSSMNWENRLKIANEFIEQIDPEVLSLQFVPFGFQEKGLPFFLGRKLKRLGGKRPWHIMFHELWLGMPMDASIKHQIWGKMQKWIIFWLIRQLSPKQIHTQSQLYLLQLNKLGFSTKYLKLFSNIPHSRVESNILEHQIKGDIVYVTVFGTIHPNAFVKEFAQQCVSFIQTSGKDIVNILIGRNGAELNNWLSELKIYGVKVEHLGEQTLEGISYWLSKSSIGIATGAPAMLEKNGTVAAMLEHGLPVICIGHDWQPRGIKWTENDYLPNGVHLLRDVNLQDLIMQRLAKSKTNTLSAISKQFINDLL